MDISSIYEGAMSTPTTSPNNSISIEYLPKREHKDIPKGSVVKSRRKSTTIQQIENGYLIIKNEEICCECSHEKESNGDEVANHSYTDWIYNSTTTYSKEKQTEIDLMY